MRSFDPSVPYWITERKTPGDLLTDPSVIIIYSQKFSRGDAFEMVSV